MRCLDTSKEPSKDPSKDPSQDPSKDTSELCACVDCGTAFLVPAPADEHYLTHKPADPTNCEACMRGKMQQPPQSSRVPTSAKPLNGETS